MATKLTPKDYERFGGRVGIVMTNDNKKANDKPKAKAKPAKKAPKKTK